MELHQVPIPTTVIIGIMHTIISIEAVFLPYIYNMPQNVHEMVADIWALSIDIGTSLSERYISGHPTIQELAQVGSHHMVHVHGISLVLFCTPSILVPVLPILVSASSI